jgi:hypothetical protein
MSIVTLANKTKARYGTKHSKYTPPGKHWLPHGPFGPETTINSIMLANAISQKGKSGFSINGSHRNVGRVGQTYKISKLRTPFKGIHPVGHGGHMGTYFTHPTTYYEDSFIAGTQIKGNQYHFMNPTNVSMRTVMNTLTRNKKYAKPIGESNQSALMYSQGMRIHKMRVANTCVLGNDSTVYENDTERNTCTYAKQLNVAMTSEQYTTTTQKGCDIEMDESLMKTSFCGR